MGLIHTIDKLNRDSYTNSKQLIDFEKEKLTKTQIKSQYIQDIDATIFEILEKYYPKYNNIDLLFYFRNDYISKINIKIIENSKSNRYLYDNFNIEQDIQNRFPIIFKKWANIKRYDLKIENSMQPLMNKFYQKSNSFSNDNKLNNFNYKMAHIDYNNLCVNIAITILVLMMIKLIYIFIFMKS